jgi:aspartate aminotransferase-like enzyme
MSKVFQGVMRDLDAMLCEVYGADGIAIVPGGGTYAMEAVARQLAGGAHAMIVRNGWFSYRWSQIFDAGDFTSQTTVHKARQTGNGTRAPFAPAPIADVVAAIHDAKPDVVFAPHVETSAGIILPDDYITQLAQAAHDVGALMVLDCIASGCAWVDMNATGVDVLISAPQKGWSSSPSAGLVMMSQRALDRLADTTSNSFTIDLKKWRQIMEAYLNDGHAYHATMPTDALRDFRDTMVESAGFGFDALRDAQWALGNDVRCYLAAKGYASVAAEGFEAPGVVVCYTDDAMLQNGSKFAAAGMQIAAGVPLAVDEPDDFKTFRIGLFGIDKLRLPDATFQTFKSVADQVL